MAGSGDGPGGRAPRRPHEGEGGAERAGFAAHPQADVPTSPVGPAASPPDVGGLAAVPERVDDEVPDPGQAVTRPAEAPGAGPHAGLHAGRHDEPPDSGPPPGPPDAGPPLGGWPFAEAPDSAAPVWRAAVALAADGVALALVGAGRLAHWVPFPAELASLVPIIDTQPRLRRIVERALGPPRADLVLALANAAALGLSRGQSSLVVDGLYRLDALSAAWYDGLRSSPPAASCSPTRVRLPSSRRQPRRTPK
jgi:hypothetical protein